MVMTEFFVRGTEPGETCHLHVGRRSSPASATGSARRPPSVARRHRRRRRQPRPVTTARAEPRRSTSRAGTEEEAGVLVAALRSRRQGGRAQEGRPEAAPALRVPGLEAARLRTGVARRHICACCATLRRVLPFCASAAYRPALLRIGGASSCPSAHLRRIVLPLCASAARRPAPLRIGGPAVTSAHLRRAPSDGARSAGAAAAVDSAGPPAVRGG